MSDAMGIDGVLYRDCSAAGYLAVPGERRYYRVTLKLTAFSFMALGTLTFQDAASDCFKRLQAISGDAVSPLLPEPVVDGGWSSVNPFSNDTVTFDVVTLGGAQLLSCAGLVQKIASGSQLRVVSLALVDASAVHGANRVSARDQANAEIEAQQSADSVVTSITSGLKSYAVFLVVVLVLVAVIAVAYTLRGK